MKTKRSKKSITPEREHDQAVDAHSAPFIEHVRELRQRIIWSLAAIVLLFVPIYYFANELYLIIAAPLISALPGETSMIATRVAAPFITPLKLSAYGALIFAMPFILHQLWAFIAPGLYLREKRIGLPLLVSSILLFYLGVSFAYLVIFPIAFQFFVSVAPPGIQVMTDISSYLEFVVSLSFAFGLSFEIPVAILLLVWAGISTPESLARKRPYVVIGCFAAGMILTPPDPVTQIALAIPAWLLFEAGLLCARAVHRRQAQESED